LTTQDIRGDYSLVGADEDTARTVHELEAEGFTTSTLPLSSKVTQLEYVLFEQNLFQVAAVVLLAISLSVVFFAFKDTKRCSVLALLGYSNSRIVFERSAVYLVNFLAVGAVSFAFAVMVSWVYNSFVQLNSVLIMGSLGIVLLLGITISLHLIATMWSVYGIDPSWIKGRDAGTAIQKYVYCVKAIVIAILVLILSTGVSALYQYRLANESLSAWSHAGDYLAASYSPVMVGVNGQERTEFDQKMRRIFSEFEESGDGILVGNNALRNPPVGDVKDPTGNVLFVNSNYLDENPIVDSFGEKIGRSDSADSHLRILIPQQHAGNREDIVKMFVDWVVFQQKLKGRILSTSDISPEVTWTLPGQKLFNYEYSLADSGTSFSDDPAILVIDSNKGLVSDDFYASLASSNQVLFRGKDRLRNELDSAGLQDTVPSVYDVKSSALTSMQKITRNLKAQISAAIFVFFASIISSLFIVTLYVEKTRKVGYIEYIHGWSFLARHKNYLRVIVCLCFSGVLLAALTVADISGPTSWIGVAVIVLADFGLSISLIYFCEKKTRTGVLKGA
ncbi:DUF1430 domain-containing protein, partial [Rhodococcus erythropolis]|uniref:bacteriocin-associated integral membrane family protein n=1 Tax=Rhodococcus erythropolis TaxID=1833 RepID=UPI002949BD8F